MYIVRSPSKSEQVWKGLPTVLFTYLVLYYLIFVCFYILDQGSLGHTGWSLVEMGQRSLRPQPPLIRNDFRYAAEMIIKKKLIWKKNRILRLFLQFTYMYLNSIMIYQKMILLYTLTPIKWAFTQFIMGRKKCYKNWWRKIIWEEKTKQ